MADAPTTRAALRGRRALARRRSRRGALLTATVATFVCTLLGVSAAGGTYAFLTATSELGGASRITSGTTGLLIDGTASRAFPAVAPAPAVPARIPFRVSNSGDAPLSLASTLTVTTAPAPGIVAATRAALAPVASEAACTSAGPGVASGPFDAHRVGSLGTLAVGGQQWMCLEASIATGTPATTAGQSFDFRLTIDGQQPTP